MALLTGGSPVVIELTRLPQKKVQLIAYGLYVILDKRKGRANIVLRKWQLTIFFGFLSMGFALSAIGSDKYQTLPDAKSERVIDRYIWLNGPVKRISEKDKNGVVKEFLLYIDGFEEELKGTS